MNTRSDLEKQKRHESRQKLAQSIKDNSVDLRSTIVEVKGTGDRVLNPQRDAHLRELSSRAATAAYHHIRSNLKVPVHNARVAGAKVAESTEHLSRRIVKRASFNVKFDIQHASPEGREVRTASIPVEYSNGEMVIGQNISYLGKEVPATTRSINAIAAEPIKADKEEGTVVVAVLTSKGHEIMGATDQAPALVNTLRSNGFRVAHRNPQEALEIEVTEPFYEVLACGDSQEAKEVVAHLLKETRKSKRAAALQRKAQSDMEMSNPCQCCNGEGVMEGRDCEECKGTGESPKIAPEAPAPAASEAPVAPTPSTETEPQTEEEVVRAEDEVTSGDDVASLSTQLKAAAEAGDWAKVTELANKISQKSRSVGAKKKVGRGTVVAQMNRAVSIQEVRPVVEAWEGEMFQGTGVLSENDLYTLEEALSEAGLLERGATWLSSAGTYLASVLQKNRISPYGVLREAIMGLPIKGGLSSHSPVTAKRKAQKEPFDIPASSTPEKASPELREAIKALDTLRAVEKETSDEADRVIDALYQKRGFEGKGAFAKKLKELEDKKVALLDSGAPLIELDGKLLYRWDTVRMSDPAWLTYLNTIAQRAAHLVSMLKRHIELFRSVTHTTVRKEGEDTPELRKKVLDHQLGEIKKMRDFKTKRDEAAGKAPKYVLDAADKGGFGFKKKGQALTPEENVDIPEETTDESHPIEYHLLNTSLMDIEERRDIERQLLEEAKAKMSNSEKVEEVKQEYPLPEAPKDDTMAVTASKGRASPISAPGFISRFTPAQKQALDEFQFSSAGAGKYGLFFRAAAKNGAKKIHGRMLKAHLITRGFSDEEAYEELSRAVVAQKDEQHLGDIEDEPMPDASDLSGDSTDSLDSNHETEDATTYVVKHNNEFVAIGGGMSPDYGDAEEFLSEDEAIEAADKLGDGAMIIKNYGLDDEETVHTVGDGESHATEHNMPTSTEGDQELTQEPEE